jgi:hypothetical protein
MPQVEFGSLYKFVASIGLVLIVAAVGLPWVLLQSTDVLLISEKSIAGLPDTAGEAIQRRQALVAWAQDHLPVPVFIALALAGLCLLGWALWKWAPSQQRSDANEQIALKKNQVEYKNLSLDEVDKKLKAEVTDTDSVSSAGAAPPAPVLGQTVDDGGPSGQRGGAPGSGMAPTDSPKTDERDGPIHPGEQAKVESPHERTMQLVARLRATENQVAQLFQKAFNDAFEVEREVKITSGVARGRVLDILLNPKSNARAQLGIEIKRFGSRVMPDRLTDFLMRATITTQDLSTGNVYTGLPGRPREAKASGILFLVLDSDNFLANAFRIERHVPTINSVMKRPIGVVLTTPERLEGLEPGELREAVANVWAEPDKIVTLE